MKAKIESINPTKAKRWLEGNTRNRKLDKKKVRQYADDMEKERWVINNDAITFDAGGRLLNGQHRLNACIVAGVPFECLVLNGAEEESFAKMDTGKGRGPSTILHLAGYGHSRGIAPIARMVLNIEHYEGEVLPRTFSKAIAIDDLLEFVEQHHNLLVEAAAAVKRSPITRPRSVWGAVYFLVVLRGGEAGRAWMHQVLTGENCVESMPSYAVRARAIRSASERVINKVAVADYVIHGWHAELRGKTLRKSQGSNSHFPIIASDSKTVEKIVRMVKRKSQ